eukprot:TRINITY_DN92206_c0_g1_i1.p1 TRINITY_DN92206_c0_g1~~TRINITY_DN92206_c0_g1_i1.p1  ORF type:complete len:872 (+),score=244.38 TRINITY_DN92206_c0_g1_i1:29-2617(+)
MAQPTSFLDAIGQSILDSANSLDAHIDASALVDRISGECTSASSRRARQFALAELKGLAKRAPAAVFATQGAVVAILRVVEKLTPTGDEDLEDDSVEPLQDCLECLGLLMEDGSGASASRGTAGKASNAKEDEAATQRGQEVAELVVKHTTNGKQLLQLLCVRETSTQYDAMVLLQRIYRRLPEPVNAAILADPRSLGHLMQVLQTCQIDYVRNECLGLLLLITASNADIQTIVTVQGFIETIFGILEEEELTAGGKVARDLLQCLKNVIGNPTCQKYLRETDGAVSLVSAITTAVTGKRLGAGAEEAEDAEDDEFDDRPDIPEESRWACLSLLVDAALALAGSRDDEESKDAALNREALVRAGALDLCRHLADVRLAEVAQLRLVQLFEALEPCSQAAQCLQRFGASSPSHSQRDREHQSSPLLFALVAVLLGDVCSLALRCCLGRVLCRCVARHSSLQSFLLSSLGPQLQDPHERGEAMPAGRRLVELLEAAALGAAGSAAAPPETLWFGLQLLLAMLLSNASVQSACATMPVSIPGDAGPAETFQELLFRAFSACARSCLLAQDDGEEDAVASDPAGPKAAASSLLGFLKLLLYWLASCPSVLASFATSPVMVPLAMDLTSLDGRCGSFFGLQIEGLACLLMGVCIKAEQGEVDVASLMTLLARRVGIETFQQKVERLWRSEALQRPPRGLAEFRWYNSRVRTFVREQQRAVQRRMVQLYVAEGVGDGNAALSEDVADHYKQLIRVQDTELREVRHENEQLRSEVEAFMTRTLKAGSMALADKADALDMENKALHTEVEQLQAELEQRSSRLEGERNKLRAMVTELELQLQSMAVSYGQVEQNNAELREALAKARGGDG